jgi:hypothetical protein
VKNDGLVKILKALHAVPRSERVAAEGCAVLAAVAAHNKFCIDAVSQQSLPLLLSCLRGHPSSESVVSHALQCVAALCTRSSDVRASLASSGMLQHVINAMNCHARSLAVQTQCCAVLNAAATKKWRWSDRSIQEAIMALGGVTKLSQAAITFDNDTTVARHVHECLHKLGVVKLKDRHIILEDELHLQKATTSSCSAEKTGRESGGTIGKIFRKSPTNRAPLAVVETDYDGLLGVNRAV